MSKSPDSLDYEVALQYQDERFESGSDILANQVETIPYAPMEPDSQNAYSQHGAQQYPPPDDEYFQAMDGNDPQQYQYIQETTYAEEGRKRMFDFANQMMTEPYYYWATDKSTPITKNDIWAICVELERIFGFQHDSVINIYDHFMIQLESRSSRMPSRHALFTLHADYIGGENANYRKWFFASQMKHDLQFSFLFEKGFKKSKLKNFVAPGFECHSVSDAIEYLWRSKMFHSGYQEIATHVLLYLLIWGEASNIRFMPECICFIFKCALDNYEAVKGTKFSREPCDFLNRIICPIYSYIRDQQFKVVDGRHVRRERDHNRIIGYDDINQLFWHHDRMEGLCTKDNHKFSEISIAERYDKLGEVQWEKACYKTYKESRSWWHLAVNFNRIWIIHFSMFWYYSSFNAPTLYTVDYSQLLNNQPTPQARLTIMSLASTIACFIQLVSVVAEFKFIPLSWDYLKYQSTRIFLIVFTLILNVAPSIFILGWIPLDAVSQLGFSLSICQFILSVFTTLIFSFQPLGNLFGIGGSRYHMYHPMTTFTASFPKLSTKGSIMSICLWLSIFVCKFTESYFFLTLSVRDPVRNLSILDMTRCHGEAYFGSFLCQYQNIILLLLMMFADMILFFLDTYLWYIIWNCMFSLTLSFFSGMSTLSPWRNVFQSLPTRIHSKILSTAEMEVKYKASILTSQIWNAVVITMYREHLLSVEQVHKLIYHQIPNESDGSTALKAPSFFLFQNDNSLQESSFFVPGSEAERRITFFAQSLSTTICEPIPVESMPTFTVLIPHFSEKILLTISEIIKEYPNSKVTQLEYLKHLTPHEWSYFVSDTKILVHDTEELKKSTEEKKEPQNEAQIRADDERDFLDNKVNEIPLYCVGYKSSAPEFTLRTRIWSSLRTQTLYRTVSGFMNYHRAIKLLHKVENPEMIELFGGSSNADHYLTEIAKKKFRMLVSMQRLQDFTAAEKRDVVVLLNTYPEVHIASLEMEVDLKALAKNYYAVLYHGLDKHKKLRQIYKIKLPGDPILGDGKSDNQNMSLIFYRGEYLEVIDANQDNYLEECLKIRSVLAEFEEIPAYPRNPYVPAVRYTGKSPVAILGAREYIFSENTGILGDVAAAKEQTFGTLFARTLSEIGGKLHYGHPDFLNAIFMTTRGGISKAQKGLHLNEDIYAGMTAILRGGRIKHCDYFQCGKGRDLGFGSILNFTSKIGGGMGEQMLSREYHYLGTQLPLDRFLSFYYAHPGFHLNNLFIIFSLHVFMLVLMNLGTMAHESILCIYDKDVPITDLHIPVGCANLTPVLDWVTRYVLSIFICFFISFLPLALHELSERGAWKAISRLFFHFISLSPLFEVFVCQIYSNSLKSDLVFGGAKYIATGRGFAITRVPFTMLYSTYATTSIYSGSRLFLLLLFGTITMKKPAIAWFWITLVSMCLSPFLFNPHQFSWTDFFLDYRDFIRWLGRGTSRWHKNSWIGFTRISRSRITGHKKRKYDKNSEDALENVYHKAPFGNTFFAEVVIPFSHSCFIFSAYTFINAQNGVKEFKIVNSILRLVILVSLPITFNTVVLVIGFTISVILGPLCGLCCSRFPTFLAGISHGLSVIFHCLLIPLVFYLEGWNFSRSLCAVACVINIQRVIFQAVKLLFLSRELREDYANRSWWSGKWIQGKYGIHIVTQPLREFPVKIVEMSLFAADFFISHAILLCLTPFLFLPYVDNIHSSLLMWIKPSKNLHGKLDTIAQSRRRKAKAAKYGILYFVVMLFLGIFVAVPVIVTQNKFISEKINAGLKFNDTYGLVQPNYQNNNDTGDAAPESIPRAKPAPVTWKTHWI